MFEMSLIDMLDFNRHQVGEDDGKKIHRDLVFGERVVLAGSKDQGPKLRHQSYFCCDFLAQNPEGFENFKFKPGLPACYEDMLIQGRRIEYLLFHSC